MLMKVSVVTDSASNLPRELAESCGIELVPMILKFGERALLDGVDMPPGEFYKALVEEHVPVSTSGPSAGDFAAAFERALTAGAEGVVCVNVASFVSATYSTAVSAAKDFGGRVRVIDSRSASLGEGFIALEAARAGVSADLDSVVARAEDVAQRMCFVATINTFEFLRRSGRVNALLAYAGTALNIKPVFAFRGGKIEQLGRPRTRARAIDRLVEEVRAASSQGPLHLGVAHADCEEEANQLLERLKAEIPHVETLITPFTPLMGAHTGPGVLGTAFFA